MNIKDHLMIDYILFRKEYEEIHKWIDAKYKDYADKGWNVWEHWKHRHHLKAIEDKYGKDTQEFYVALMHIITDFLSHIGIFKIPKNEKEALEILIDEGLI